MKGKQVLAILTCLMLAVGMLSGITFNSFAAEVENSSGTSAEDGTSQSRVLQNLSIAGETLTKEKGELRAGDGSISYEISESDGEEKVTLTLKEASVKADSTGNGTSGNPAGAPAAVIYYSGSGVLSISLEGENSLRGERAEYAVYAPNARVEFSGEAGASLTAEAAPENSNAVRAREITFSEPLEVTAPGNTYIYEGQNPDYSAYKTIAYAGNGRNLAATSVTMQVPGESRDNQDSGTAEDEPAGQDTGDAESAENETEEVSAGPAETAAEDAAGEEQSTNLRINGETIPARSEDGSILYNRKGSGAGETILLTLKDVSLEADASDAAIAYEGEGTLRITLEGENRVSGKGYGIYAPNGKVRFTGTAGGSLEVSAAPGEEDPTFAVFAKGISVKEPLEIKEPKDSRFFDGQHADENGILNPYQTVSYLNENGIELAAISVKLEMEIPADHEHTWGTPEYEWSEDNSSCTASRICSLCGEKETETVEAARTDVEAQDCEGAGTLTLTAEFTNSAFAKQEKTAEVENAGHDWNFDQDAIRAKLVDEGAAVEYTLTCRRNPEHTTTIQGEPDYDRTEPPTKTEEGTLWFKAVLDGKELSSAVKVKPAGDRGYSITVNPGSYSKYGTNPVEFVVDRQKYDAVTYPAFVKGGSVSIDGNVVDNGSGANYQVQPGSLMLSISPSYLDSLEEGAHTLRIDFTDGSVETKLDVRSTGAAPAGGADNGASTNTVNNGNSGSDGSGASSGGSTFSLSGHSWKLPAIVVAVLAILIGLILFLRSHIEIVEVEDDEEDEEGGGDEAEEGEAGGDDYAK